VLLKKPQWIFADEATSALDETAEKMLYAQLLAQTQEAGGALVSIAHRPTVAAFHSQRWELEKTLAGAEAAYTLTVR
jgi:putative ATP-binding cassette transporter